MSGVWDRDEAAAFVETLFAKHQGEIYAYLLRMMRDPEVAADMTQDAFIKAYKNYETLEKPENARGVDHIGFSCGGPSALADEYERLKGLGISPTLSVNHPDSSP